MLNENPSNKKINNKKQSFIDNELNKNNKNLNNNEENNENNNEFQYSNYRDLSFQEIENYKNKYDNRLYMSYRFKLWDNRIEAKDELFLKTRNTQILAHGKVIFKYQRIF